MHTYRFECMQGQARGIQWHGYRYEFTNILDRALVTLDDDDEPLPVCYAEFTEVEAWNLKQAWENDGETLACGSSELIQLCAEFIGRIV